MVRVFRSVHILWRKKKVKNRGEGKRMASSSGEWFLAIFPFLFQCTKKPLFYRNAPTDKLYFVLSHQWHLYFLVASLLFYVLFSDIWTVMYFVLNHGWNSHFDFKMGCVFPSYFYSHLSFCRWSEQSVCIFLNFMIHRG